MNDCYSCKHRRNLPGDAHISCAAVPEEDHLGAMFLVITTGRYGSVVGDTHGILNGWFAWPMNFDPVWLRACGMKQPVEVPNES